MDESSASPRRGGLARVFLIAATLGVYFVFAFTAATHMHNRVGLGGTPLFYDFSAFYKAGAFADAGRAAAAYDDKAMIAAEQATFVGATTRLPWNYPPSFQLLLAPLALLPYVAAWLVWSIAIYGLYAVAARQLAGPGPLWPLLLAPGAAVNLFFGQNGLLSTLLLAGGVLVLKRRPILGGVLLGLMAYKPQVAVLVPLALLAGREWRALAAGVACVVGLALISAAILGVGPWLAFLHKAVQPEAVFSSSSSDWRGITSTFVMARTLMLDPRFAAALQWVVAAAAAAAAAWVWFKTKEPALRAGSVAAATLLATPYVRPYDLAMLVCAVAALTPAAARARGTGERVAAVVGWAAPGVLMFAMLPIQPAPIVSGALLAFLVWRVAHPPGAADALANRPHASPAGSRSGSDAGAVLVSGTPPRGRP